MFSNNSYVIRASDATNALTANQNGNTSISGNLDAAGRILVDGSHLNVQPKSSTSSETLVLDQSMSSEFGSDSHGINVYGRRGGNSRLKFYNSKGGPVCNVLTDGNLDVGVGASSSKIKTHFNDSGYVGYMQMEARNKADGFLHFETNYQYGEMYLIVRCIYFYKM